MITKKPITKKLMGVLTKSSVIRWVYRFAASSTTMATTVMAIASTAATISPAFERVLAADSGFGSKKSPRAWDGWASLDASTR